MDGPAGAGKGTVAEEVAASLDFVHFDSGALYRTIGIHFYESIHRLPTEEELMAALSEMHIEVKPKGNSFSVFLEGQDITDRIYRHELSEYAAFVSQFVPVRKFVEAQTRSFSEHFPMVVDGRDTTTIIFPDATLKVYLDANLDVRTERRHEQLMERGQDVSFEQLKADVEKRDTADMAKPYGALVRAPDAFYIDTSHLSIPEVTAMILSAYHSLPTS